MPVSFVTPSTSWAISSPNSSRTCSSVGVGVLDDVVQERGGDRLVVEPQLGADLGGAERVVDELLAGPALLALVARAANANARASSSRSTSGL